MAARMLGGRELPKYMHALFILTNELKCITPAMATAESTHTIQASRTKVRAT